MTDQMKPLSPGSYRAVSVFLRVVAAIFGFGILLHTQIARAEAPERNFSVVKTEADGVTIEIGNSCSVETVIRSFQRQFHASTATPENPAGEELNWRMIYETNKGHVIPACKVPGDGYSWSRTRTPDVWLRCPDIRDQHLILIQGRSDLIKIPMRAIETTQQKLERLNAQDTCLRNPTSECLTANAKAAKGKVAIELKTSDAPAPVVTAPPASQIPTSVTPPRTAPVAGPAESESTAQIAWAFALFLLCLCIAGIVYVSKLRRSHKAVVEALRNELDAPRSLNEGAVESRIAKIREEHEATLAIERDNVAREKELAAKYVGTISSNSETIRRLDGEVDTARAEGKAYTGRLDSAKQALLAGAMKFGYVLPQQASLADSIQSVFAQAGTAHETLKRERNDARRERDDVQQELDGAQRELASIQAATKRLAEVYQAFSVHEPRLIQIDDRLAELKEPYAELRAHFDDQVAHGDPASAETQASIEEFEAEMRPLGTERESLAAQLEALRPEFEELHQRLTGFELKRDRLYQEAQRDRSEAAAEMGKARAMLQSAETKRTYVQRAEEKLRQDRADLETERGMLVDAKTEIDHQATVVRGLFTELLEAANLPPETTLEDIEQRGAVSGLIAEIVARVRGMEKAAETYNATIRRSTDEMNEARGKIAELEGEKAELTAQVSTLMQQSPLEDIGRVSALPPLPKDIYALTGHDDAQSPESPTNGGGHAEEETPPSDTMEVTRTALKGLRKGTTYVVESVEDLLALRRFSEDIVFDADPRRLCAVHGRVPTQVERMVNIDKVQTKLGNLRFGDLGWVLETFQQYMAVPSAVRTIVPMAGAAPPAEGGVTPGNRQAPD